MYVGGYERNFPNLTTSSTSFEGTDGSPHEYRAWPTGADGVHVYYMEKSGKKFMVVRVADSGGDVVLENPLVLVPGEHFGFGTRLSGEPTSVEDDVAIGKLLEDVIKKNMSQSGQLMPMRERLIKASHSNHGK